MQLGFFFGRKGRSRDGTDFVLLLSPYVNVLGKDEENGSVLSFKKGELFPGYPCGKNDIWLALIRGLTFIEFVLLE